MGERRRTTTVIFDSAGDQVSAHVFLALFAAHGSRTVRLDEGREVIVGR